MPKLTDKQRMTLDASKDANQCFPYYKGELDRVELIRALNKRDSQIPEASHQAMLNNVLYHLKAKGLIEGGLYGCKLTVKAKALEVS